MPGIVRRYDNCFTGDTLIPLLDGRAVSIQDLVGVKTFYVYSYNFQTGKVEPGRASNCRLVEANASLVEITLDDGISFRVTPDHKIMLRNGSYKQAGKLSIGDSLMPLYRRVKHNKTKDYFEIGDFPRGYEEVLQPNGKWEPTHRMVFNWKYGKGFSKRLTTAHHKDFNSRNNAPSNILAINHVDHFQYHSKFAKKMCAKMIKEGNHPFITLENRNKTKKRMLEDNPMKRGEVKRRVLLSNIANGSLQLFSEKNISDNPMNKVENREKMVLARRKNGSYGIEKMAFLAPPAKEKAREFNSRRMKARNPQADPIIKQQRLEATAQRYGFSDNAQACELISWIHSNFKWGGRKIANHLGCTRDFVTYRMRANHKVLSVKYLVQREDVFCFTVDLHHNFAIEAGVFVSNCSGHG